MFDRVLVPLDGSPVAEAVLPELWRMLRPHDSEVILLRSQQPIPVEAWVVPAAILPPGHSDYLLEVMNRFLLRGYRVRILERIGPPASTIIQAAVDEQASLVAMATHGRKGLPRLLLGSVTEQVLRTCPVPLLAVRPTGISESACRAHPIDWPMRSVLVPLDGSERSKAIVPHAIEFARSFGASVAVLRALNPAAPASGVSSEGLSERDSAARQLGETSEQFRLAGVHAETLLEEGDPAERILNTCVTRRIDLIAMATHGRTGWSRLVGGSVAEKVLRETPVPMLVAREAAVPTREAAPVPAHRGREEGSP